MNGRQTGLMVMSDPKNPPTWSHSRDYGVLVANSFPVDRPPNRQKKHVIRPGQRLRYGVLVHETPETAVLERERVYAEFANER